MKKSKFWDEKLPVATQIRAMEAGGKIAFPMEKMLSIRANLSTYALILRRKYSSHINRKDDVIEVWREE